MDPGQTASIGPRLIWVYNVCLKGFKTCQQITKHDELCVECSVENVNSVKPDQTSPSAG